MATETFVTIRSQTKYLDLWNGTSNNAPPSGWETVGFDDSAWNTVTANPTVSGNVNHNRRMGPGAFTLMNPPSDIELLWPTTTPSDATAGALFRWHWNFVPNLTGTPPNEQVLYTIHVHATTGTPAFDVSGTGLRLFVNGNASVSFDWQNNTLAVNRRLWADITAVGDNVFAAGVFDPSNTTLLSGNTAWIGFKLEIDTGVLAASDWAAVIG